MLTLACAWGPGTTSPGRPREEEEASESPSSCKNIRHPAAPRGLSPSGNTAPGAPPRSLPEASRSLFPQLFLHGPRRRVGGEGRRKGVRVGCLAGMWELRVRGGSRLRVQSVLGLPKPLDSAGTGKLRPRACRCSAHCLVFCKCAKSLQWCLIWVTLWTVAHQVPLFTGILQARILEWVVMPFSRGSS